MAVKNKGKSKKTLTRAPVQFEKDQYGAIEVGKAVVKPDKVLGYTDMVYKMAALEAIARAAYQSFDFKDGTFEGKKVIGIELAMLPVEKYEKMKRKIRRLEKKLKETK